jgi:hypothetical protein
LNRFSRGSPAQTAEQEETGKKWRDRFIHNHQGFF